MVESNNYLTLILVINSIVIIGLILNQNDTSKDSFTSQKFKTTTTLIEKVTWISIILQLSILLIKIKNNDF